MSKNQMILNVIAIYSFFSGFLVPFVFDIDFSEYSVAELLVFLTVSLMLGNLLRRITLKDKKNTKPELEKSDFKWTGFFYVIHFYDFIIMPCSVGVFFIGAFLIL